METKLQELINKHMPKRYYGHEARRYAKLIAEEYSEYILNNNVNNPNNLCLACKGTGIATVPYTNMKFDCLECNGSGLIY